MDSSRVLVVISSALQANRLSGSVRSWCVIFDRVSTAAAAGYVRDKLTVAFGRITRIGSRVHVLMIGVSVYRYHTQVAAWT